MQGKIFLIAAVLFSCGVQLRAAGGRPGGILEWGADARSLGAGGAFVAFSDDASAAYGNPAAIPSLPSGEVSMLQCALWEGTRLSAASLALPVGAGGGLGLSLSRIASDGFERRDSDGQYSGSFGVAETGITLSCGRRLAPAFSLGAALNCVSRAVDTRSSNLYGFDMSAFCRLLPGTRAGLRLANLAAGSDEGTDDRLAPLARIGIAQRCFGGRALVGVDLDSLGGWYAGTEAAFAPFFLRVGVNEGEVTGGFGLAFLRYRLDYAMAQHALGMSHRFSLSWRFSDGPTEKSEVKKGTERKGKGLSTRAGSRGGGAGGRSAPGTRR